jgi:hypothetical protein
VAETQWCRDASYVLEVRLVTDSVMPVVRLKAGPSTCEWLFDRMPEGRYEALILSAGDEHIVASGINRLSRQATALIVAASSVAEIEGRVNSPRALPSPLRLKFTLPDGKSWTAPVAADGGYHVTLGGIGERTLLAISAEGDDPQQSAGSRALNVFPIESTSVSPGLIRLDLDDVTLPPVVVHVDVPEVAAAGFAELAEVMIDDQRSVGFKLLRGLHGQFLASYGEHTVTIWTNDRQHVITTTAVRVSPMDTDVRVVVRIPQR